MLRLAVFNHVRYLMQKILPKDLTSYDLLKTAAVILMIIDHVGAYYMPDIIWMRLAGRLCVPIWFFLVGYAHSRDTGLYLWVAALVLIVSDFIAGMNIFPLNILVTILIVRFVLDFYMKIVLRHFLLFWVGALLLLFFAPPTLYIVDYGTQGLILAVFGYLVRHYQDDARKRASVIFPYLVFSALVYTGIQAVILTFLPMEVLFLLAGNVLVLLMLSEFMPTVFARPSHVLLRPFAWLLQMMGRHTLLIYVGHLLLIKAVGLWLFPQSFQFLHWHYSPLE